MLAALILPVAMAYQVCDVEQAALCIAMFSSERKGSC